jgi:growth factor-regulated tyrosine kinase substrate
MALPRLGINDAVRVCEPCFSKINGTTTPNEPIEQENMQEDTELERAIQESLKLSKKQNEPRKSTSTPKPAKDDYDEDLKKAIEASLKESQPNYEQQNQLIQNHTSNHVKDSRAPNISPTEIENIRLFCELVEKIEKQGGNMEQLMNMYQNTILLQRKLVMQIEDCANLYKELYDFNTEVNEAIREYDALQQKRATFSQGTKGNPTYAGQIFTPNYYPSPGYTPSHPIQPGYPFAHAPGQLQSSEHPHTFTSYPISNTGMPNEGATPFAPPLTVQSRESQFTPNVYQPDIQYQLNAANNYFPNQQQGALAATTQVGYPPQSYSSVPQPNQNPQLQASYPPMNPQYSFQGTQQIQHNQNSANEPQHPKVAPQDEPLIQL